MLTEDDVRRIIREEIAPDIADCPECGAPGLVDFDVFCRGCGRLHEERWVLCVGCRHEVPIEKWRDRTSKIPDYCPLCSRGLVPISESIQHQRAVRAK